MMFDQLTRGFEIDGRFMPWGATIDQCDDGEYPSQPRQGLISRTYPCRSVEGIAAINVKLTAMRSDRPVTQLCYDLASSCPTAEDWLQLFTAGLGRPGFVEWEDLPPDASLADRVALYARWEGDVVTVGLSVYGAPRSVEHGVAAACLWISWHTEAAAKPFLDEWHQRNIELVSIATRISDVRTFALAVDLYGRSPGPGRESALALSMPEILDTPPSIAARLGARSFALWRSVADACWGASNKWDTISFAIGRQVEISHIELQPAKGGGRSELRIGSWDVFDCYGGTSIKTAAAHLAAMPGIKIKKYGGYDC